MGQMAHAKLDYSFWFYKDAILAKLVAIVVKNKCWLFRSVYRSLKSSDNVLFCLMSL
jgi:hypothetical protein